MLADRVLHRGGANRSTRDRDVAYFSFHRDGFEPSTHFEATRSLRAVHASLRQRLDPSSAATAVVVLGG